MPDPREIVINTCPLIALTAALGDLRLLEQLYDRVVVPFEVSQEILVDSASRFAAAEFENANWLDKKANATRVSLLLRNSLGSREASVIQVALEEHIATVCIDEHAGRRLARLHGLKHTGSLGILIRAKREGYLPKLSDAIHRMRIKGIRLSDRLVQAALRQVGEA